MKILSDMTRLSRIRKLIPLGLRMGRNLSGQSATYSTHGCASRFWTLGRQAHRASPGYKLTELSRLLRRFSRKIGLRAV